jgi:hypothetical protein
MRYRGVVKLKRLLDELRAVPLERPAEILQWHPRTLRRRLDDFELIRRGGAWWVSVRSLRQHLEEETYRGTEEFDVIRDSQFGDDGSAKPQTPLQPPKS